MATRYCPYCKKIVIAKTLPLYMQVECQGILVKKRRVVHRVEDGGCGNEWYTLEVPAEILEIWLDTVKTQKSLVVRT